MADLIKISKNHHEKNSHVIFLHGLNGDPYESWGASQNSKKKFWPKWLEKDITDLTVWSIGYHAAISRWRGEAMHFTERATNILELILAEPNLKNGEIILIGHSMGGLIIKQMLRTAESMGFQRFEADSFVKRVRRIAFIATPHLGSDQATWVDRLRIFIRPSAATASLLCNAPALRDLNIWYREWSAEYTVSHLILIESQTTKILGMIVKPESGDPGLLTRSIPIDANHITICKPSTPKSEVYTHILRFINTPSNTNHRRTTIENSIAHQSVKLETLITSTQNIGSLVENNFSGLTHSLLEQGEKTARLLGEKLQQAQNSSSISIARKFPSKLIDDEIQKNLLSLRRARNFGGFDSQDYAKRFAEQVSTGEFECGSDSIRSIALSWCSRILSRETDISQSEKYLQLAQQLGNSEEVAIADAFIISARGDLGSALNKLAIIPSSHARSASLYVAIQHKNEADVIDWLANAGLTIADLDPDGKSQLIILLFNLRRWKIACEHVESLDKDDYEFTPVLLHLAAITNLIQVIPEELRIVVLQQIPFDVDSFPLASDAQSLRLIKNAIDLFSRCETEARNLNCIDVANMSADYALWLKLRDPNDGQAALIALHTKLRDQRDSLRYVPFALKFGIQLDVAEVEKQIDRCMALTGEESFDGVMARFALVFAQENKKSAAEYFHQYREHLKKFVIPQSFNQVEINLLSGSGQFQLAENRLETLSQEGISEEEQNTLRRIISVAKEDNPTESRRMQFEKSGLISDLVSLVYFLKEQQDWKNLCDYGARLFAKTRALINAEDLALALSEENRYIELASFLREYPEFLSQSENLQTLWSWTLYREGLLNESAQALALLRTQRDHPNDRKLRINLAITSGDWESLAHYVEEEWTRRSERNANELMGTAQLAHYINAPRAKDLMLAAAAKGQDNATILMASYNLATSAGCEDNIEVGQWLQKAIDLSGDNGPVRRMSLQELLERKPEWDQQVNNALEKLTSGEIPIFLAARFLQRSLIDIFLVPALTNLSARDPRTRIIIPAYSGARQPVQQSNIQCIAIDAPSLLTMGTMKVLNTVSEAFDHIIIPHSTMGWLFEEKRNVSFHQPNRIKNARILRGLLANGTLKQFKKYQKPTADLITDIGEDLASFISEAMDNVPTSGANKFVIRSNPVYRINSLMTEVADLSTYSSCLCSCLAVVNKLKQKGLLTVAEDTHARSYLSLHENDWPQQPELSDNANIYLDDLSITYLQHIGILEKLENSGLSVYISNREVEEIDALLNYDQLTSEVTRIIEDVRSFVAIGIKSGRVKLAPVPEIHHINYHADQENDELNFRHHPSMEIFTAAKDVDALIIDDRYFNQHQNISDGTYITPILTTLDLVDLLHSRGKLDQARHFDIRTKVRLACYFAIPITTSELHHHLSLAETKNGHIIESAELKAIRENLLRICMSSFLKLPKETAWLDGIMQTLMSTLKKQWSEEIDEEIAAAKSDWLLIILDARGWAHCLEIDSDLQIADRTYYLQILGLLVTTEMSGPTRKKYFNWLDSRILFRLRDERPDVYSCLIERVKSIINNTTHVNELSEVTNG
ncbi:esterase/lipase family protein [Solimicrobium silvestre]|uniref:Putative serine esterase (DUF676) n=1 Tax=Solimicrobium silvestre TaxID=2099400 RepID=A0A2S9GWL9_9BURK|nr:HNH endonuclease [Solimicrobium silvestre]PRC92091.1 putative serine esterase (DUF676) [Solimicrobium silvestre]